MNKIIFASIILALFSFAQSVLAHCLLCTGLTAGAVTISRVYGVDDLVFGVFLGGFVISGALWLNNVLNKRKIQVLPYQSWMIVAFSVVSTLVTFSFAGLLGTYKLFGFDRIVVGTLSGVAVSLLVFEVHDFLRKNNGNKNHIPFQGMVMLILFLAVTAFAFYVLELV